MKTKLTIIAFILLSCVSVQAQRQLRVGYIDMNYILEQLPSYQEANAMLDQKALKWKGEIALKRKQIDNLKEELENERPLLTQDLIDERQDEITYLQKQLVAYQQERFGPQGDLVAQRRQIVQPIQDQVFNAIQEIGLKREYDFIFDGSADALMLFAAERHDISDRVLQAITRTADKVARQEEQQSRKEAAENIEEKPYKSVSQARKDDEEEATREAKIQAKQEARQAIIDKREHTRDSIRAVRQAKYEADRAQAAEKRQARRDAIENARQTDVNNQAEAPTATQAETSTNSATNNQTDREARRAKLLQERQERRDSIKQARQALLKERQEKRDSIIKAREKARETRE